jgi:hypothetical protein
MVSRIKIQFWEDQKNQQIWWEKKIGIRENEIRETI